jgi:Poly(3-hydroxyalkanoate) synthetase
MTEGSETNTEHVIDRMFHAWLGTLTFGLSPAALMLAYLDWLIHLSVSPGKQADLVQKAISKTFRFALYALHSASDPNIPPCIAPLPQDRRYHSDAWQHLPFNLAYQSFLLTQQWWHNATTGIHGISRQHEEVVSFAARQLLDVFSPSNFLPTNPEVLQATLAQGGANLVRGWLNFIEDWGRAIGDQKLAGKGFRVGKTVAITPGKVIYRNRLIELIQYSPGTQKVWREPVLIIPAWIMKYYILDLSPQASLVKYLVNQGHTVFMVSWKNPGPADRDLGMEDYRSLGVMEALNGVSAVIPDTQIHAVGYCLGGTLLSIAAAAMARDGDDRLKTITLLAAQTDFEEAGELTLFMNESQLAFLEDIMWEQGYLDSKQMAGAFGLLRSNDLIWSTVINDYLLGKRQALNDLMAWNADATRMPYRMHSEYLHSLYLHNDLAERRYRVGGRTIAISDIRAPMFVVGTQKDHVAPWRSVFNIHHLAHADEVTFLLTSGGHNAGIVSEPGHPHRSYQLATSKLSDRHIDPDAWLAQTPTREGSWWPAWQAWLHERSSEQVAPPPLGAREAGYAPLCDAPGTYVFQE